MVGRAAISIEVVLFNDGGEVRAHFTLQGSCLLLEAGELFGVVDALFEHVELWLAHVHLVVQSEKAFTSCVEGLKADWLESEVL